MKKVISGYVIRSIDYSENDLILTILTKENTLETIRARGAKKIGSKNMAATLLYANSEFEVSIAKNTYQTINSSLLISYPHKITSSIYHLFCLSIACEYINESVNENSYQTVEKIIHLINEGISPKLIMIAVLNEIMSLEGCSLNVDECLRCGSTQSIIYFSFEDGGYLCKNCSPTKSLDVDFLKKIRYLIKINYENCSKIIDSDRIINNVIINLIEVIEEQTGIYFSSRKVLNQTLKKEI